MKFALIKNGVVSKEEYHAMEAVLAYNAAYRAAGNGTHWRMIARDYRVTVWYRQKFLVATIAKTPAAVKNDVLGQLFWTDGVGQVDKVEVQAHGVWPTWIGRYYLYTVAVSCEASWETVLEAADDEEALKAAYQEFLRDGITFSHVQGTKVEEVDGTQK